MAKKKEMARTMRIDLIPDVPSAPLKGNALNRVVVSSGDLEDKGLAPDRVQKGTSTSRYQELLESIYDATLIADLSGVITEVNARALQFLQMEQDELVGKSVSDIISGADNSLVESLVSNLESRRFTLIQAYCVRKDGSYFPSEIAVNRFRAGRDSLCFFVRDITVRRQAEEMLRTEHNAIQNAANGIAICNLDGDLEYANPALAEMLGCTSSEGMVGMDIRDIIGVGEGADQMLNQVLEGYPWSGELAADKEDGSELELAVLATCNRNSEGQSVGVVFSFTDLSDRKLAEAATREAERQRVMLESLGAACHHLGQPATVLMANLGIIQSRLETSDAMISNLLEGSLRAVDRLGEVLHKLNKVNEYRTTNYAGDENDSDRARILDI